MEVLVSIKLSVSDYWFKKIGKMIDSEDNGSSYEINDRYVPKLLDLRFIVEKKWTQVCMGAICSFSSFFVTHRGRKYYKEWKNEIKN